MNTNKQKINWPFVRVFAVAVGGWIVAACALFTIDSYDTVLGFPFPNLTFDTPNGVIFFVSGLISMLASMYWMHNFGPFLVFRYEEAQP